MSFRFEFEGPDGEALLRCCFTKVYDDQNRLIPDRLARWEALRSRYVGRDVLLVDGGALVARLTAA